MHRLLLGVVVFSTAALGFANAACPVGSFVDGAGCTLCPAGRFHHHFLVYTYLCCVCDELLLFRFGNRTDEPAPTCAGPCELDCGPGTTAQLAHEDCGRGDDPFGFRAVRIRLTTISFTAALLRRFLLPQPGSLPLPGWSVWRRAERRQPGVLEQLPSQLFVSRGLDRTDSCGTFKVAEPNSAACVCPPGWRNVTLGYAVHDDCGWCLYGHWCRDGLPHPCPAGRSAMAQSSLSDPDCLPCGFPWGDNQFCPEGNYYPYVCGQASVTLPDRTGCHCVPGFYTDVIADKLLGQDCVTCPENHACAGAFAAPVACVGHSHASVGDSACTCDVAYARDPARRSIGTRAINGSDCFQRCPPGRYTEDEAESACKDCPRSLFWTVSTADDYSGVPRNSSASCVPQFDWASPLLWPLVALFVAGAAAGTILARRWRIAKARRAKLAVFSRGTQPAADPCGL